MGGKIIDFSFYVKKRAAIVAEAEIASAFENVNTPGSIIDIKHKIGVWFELKKELAKLIAAA